MKKNNKKWLVWAILGVLIAGGLFYWIKRDTTPKIQLETTYPVMGDLSQSITATGKVEPVDTVAVGTQVSGTIKNIYVDFNSKVKKGQLLAVLDPELLRDQMLQMNANLQSAKSNQAYNEINFNRQTQLYKVGAISKADYDNAQNAYNASKAQVGAVGAQLAAANKNLSLTSIYSPIDGTVLNRNISEGQTVAASFSTPTLFSIAKDLSKMQVRATIDEADIGNVQAGQKVSFTVDAFPNESFNGTVSEVRLQPTISANVVNYITMINADNTSLKLKPGMTANITVTTKELPKVMKIPAQAVAFHPDSLVAKAYVINAPAFKNSKKHGGSGKQGFNKKRTSDEAGVWILNKDNTIVHKKIKTGMDNDTEIQVISGLEIGDNIITGYKMLTKKSSKGAAKSPFLPQRSGGNRGNNAGGGGPR